MSKPLGPYVPVCRAGDFIFVSGQGGLDDGVKVDGGVIAETIQTMRNIRAQLESVGATMDDVVKTTCFLIDMDDYAKFNAEYSAAFGDHRPARSCVAVKALPAGFLVEVEVIAHKPVD